MKKKFIYIVILIILMTSLYAQDNFQIPVLKSGDSLDLMLRKIMGGTKYKATIGDIYQISISTTNITDKGESQRSFTVTVSDKYELDIPFMGKINVKGIYFSELQDLILKRLKAEFSANYVDFKLIAPGVFDVFIYGSVKIPGFTTATSLSRVADIVSMAGLTETSSYRRVQLIRNNKTSYIDFVKYINDGDLNQNPVLEPGDKLYVPVPLSFCQVQGMVLKPGKYELVEGESLSDMLKLCGGIPAIASVPDIVVSRFEEDNTTKSYTVKYTDANQFLLKNGDAINIKSYIENRKTILVEGALFGVPYKGTGPQTLPLTPVVVNLPYFPGMTLLTILESTGGPTPFAKTEKSMVIRRATDQKIPVDVRQLWETKDKNLDVELEAGDHIFIPMMDLKVIMAGFVNKAGAFPYSTESKVGDYLVMAGGINPESGSIAEIYKLDPHGEKIRVGLETYAEPGATYYVDKNSWIATTTFLGQVTTIVTFATGVVLLSSYMLDVIAKWPR